MLDVDTTKSPSETRKQLQDLREALAQENVFMLARRASLRELQQKRADLAVRMHTLRGKCAEQEQRVRQIRVERITHRHAPNAEIAALERELDKAIDDREREIREDLARREQAFREQQAAREQAFREKLAEHKRALREELENYERQQRDEIAAQEQKLTEQDYPDADVYARAYQDLEFTRGDIDDLRGDDAKLVAEIAAVRSGIAQAKTDVAAYEEAITRLRGVVRGHNHYITMTKGKLDKEDKLEKQARGETPPVSTKPTHEEQMAESAAFIASLFGDADAQ